MKHIRATIGSISALLIPVVFGGQVFAATQSLEQQIVVTAVVPSHRDIILDTAGRIVEITSNTLEDVTPDVHRLSAIPENKLPLTPELSAAYRKLVPIGTAKRGTLYKQSVVAVITQPQRGSSESTASGKSIVRTDLSRLLSAKFAVEKSSLFPI